MPTINPKTVGDLKIDASIFDIYRVLNWLRTEVEKISKRITVVINQGVSPAILDHALLNNLNSTNYTHLTAANATDLTDGGLTTLHSHSSLVAPDGSPNPALSIDNAGNVILPDFGNSGERGIRATMGTNDFWTIRGIATSEDVTELEIATGDNGATAGIAEPIQVRQYWPGAPWVGNAVTEMTLLDTNGRTKIPNNTGIGKPPDASVRLDVDGTVRASQYIFPGLTGDPSPVITARTVPAGQGNATEKTELILFHSNDPVNGAGVDQITLRAPAISLQSYNNSGVSDIDNDSGYNERLYINSIGDVGIGHNLPVGIVHPVATSQLAYNVGPSASSGTFIPDVDVYPPRHRINSGSLTDDGEIIIVGGEATQFLRYNGHGYVCLMTLNEDSHSCRFKFDDGSLILSEVFGDVVDSDIDGYLCIIATPSRDGGGSSSGSTTIKIKNRLNAGTCKVGYDVVFYGNVYQLS